MTTFTTEDRIAATIKPVAWMFQGAFDISTYVSFEKPNPDIYPNPTPLYTHPADITDEEIEMNNKPVAVYINKDDGLVCAKCCNPLYTHPAKTLTNEPVAWTDGKGNYFDKNSFFPVDDLTPLYRKE